jgi:uncharacterized protein with HEPN domain
MRDKLVHDYMGVDLEAVWDTAVWDVPALLARMEQLGDFQRGPPPA